MTRTAKKQKVERQQFYAWQNTDAALWCPTALVGAPVRIFWPDEGRYFTGRIVKYVVASFGHKVHYEDGDEETLVLAIEKLQLPSDVITNLPAPSVRALAALARHLDCLADQLEEKAIQQRTTRGRAMMKDEDRHKLELLRRRAADVRSAKKRRELLLRTAQETHGEPPRAEAAAAAPLTAGRLQHAVAVNAAAAIAPIAHGRGSASKQHYAVQQQQLQPATSGPVADSSRQVAAVHTEPWGRRVNVGSGPECASVPFRVRSPSSARRRQSLLGQPGRKQGRGQRSSGHADAAEGRQGCETVAASGSNAGQQGLDPDRRAAAAPPATCGAAAWGAMPRDSGRSSRAAADADIGKLYVPCAWPILRAAASAAPAGLAEQDMAGLPSGGGDLPGQIGPRKAATERQQGGKESAACSGGGARGRVSDEERRRVAAAGMELLEAYKHFRRHCSAFKQYHELQVALWLSPEQLVGREIRVLWPDEGAWFCGRVTRYEADRGMHTVEYDDGDVEHLHLAVEEVRLQMVPGEAERGLAPRPPEELRRVAECLAAGVAQLQRRSDALQEQQNGKGKPAALAQHPEHTTDQREAAAAGEVEELICKAERWANRAAHLQALAAVMHREAAAGVAGERPGTSFEGLRRQDSNAGPAGKPAATGAAKAASMVVAPRANSSAAVSEPGAAHPHSDQAAEAARQDLGCESGLEDADGAGRCAGCPTAPIEPPLPCDWATRQALQPGEVVWAQVRRSTPWPAIVITREEAEREGMNVRRAAVLGTHAKQTVFVRFFGDHTVLGLPFVEPGGRVPDRGGVLPFLAGLDLGWHAHGGVAAVAAGGNASVSQAAGPAGGGTGGPRQRFLRAMFELRSYMTEGELPPGMIPPNYDDEDDEEEDGEGDQGEPQQEAEGAGGAGQRGAEHRARGGGSLPGEPGPAAGDRGAAAAMPLMLGRKLRVLQLGEVMWLSSWFHDEKYIYPVGFKAERVMASSASGGCAVPHLMEVSASEDGVRPVFRITPEGESPVCADTATRAMRALFKDDARASGRAFARTGADLFGLGHPRVAALVRSLPGAERCERFANWPDQDRPPLPPLTLYEELQRRAVYARALRLPKGVRAVPQAKTGMCFECEVCGEDEESPCNLKLECDLCRCVVHARCYGVLAQPPHGALWLCDVCQLHAAGLPRALPPPCELCPVAGGPMKRGEAGGYVHVLCALWTPGVTFGDPDVLEPVEGVAKAVQNRSSLRCCLCKQLYGACIQCAGDARCYTAFHPMCAREAGLAMCELRQAGAAAAARARPRRHRGGGGGTTAKGAPQAAAHDDHGTADMEVEGGKENMLAIAKKGIAVASQSVAAGAGAQAGGADKDCGQLPGGGGRLPLSPRASDLQLSLSDLTAPVNAASSCGCAPPASVHGDTAAAAADAAAGVPPRRGRGRPRKDGRVSNGIPGAEAVVAKATTAARDLNACLGGVLLGNGISLACFCSRHEDLVLHTPHVRCSYPGGRFANRRAELVRQQLRGRRQELTLLQQGHAPNPPRPPPALPPPTTTTAATAATQGRWGGEVVMGFAAAAGAGEASGADDRPTGRAMSFADWRSRGHRAPEAMAIAREKRKYVRQLPYIVTGRLQQDGRVLAGLEGRCVHGGGGDGNRGGGGAPVATIDCDGRQGILGSGREKVPVLGAVAAGAANLEHQRQEARSGLPPPALEAAAAAGAVSVAERYAAMRASVGLRLAAGKSAIHGWGAFAKVPHKRGDMLIEYAGELIRPSVSDVRERRMYDKLVGCGTYIFTLNDDTHIDATRAGNMAHLLNHSCDPNCYSRTITLSDPATGAMSDHVIITAKRDIEAFEELTYDYRFSSAEELPCNCGAATCRLLVNWPEQQLDDDEEEGAGQEERQGAP